jgi:hypothetical protein
MDSIKDSRPPGAPDGPDFWRLSEVILGLDADSEGDIEAIFADTGYTVEALIYMATQRAMRAINEAPAPRSLDDIVATYGATWTDGFIAGIRAGRYEGGAA